MRHFRAYILLAALAAGISCAQKEQEWVAPATEPEQEPETEVTTYEYRFSLAENETKAHLNDNGVFWDGGDKVGLFLGSAASIAADVDAETTPKTVVFSSNNPISAGTNVYAYYPYQEGNTDPAAATVTIPAVQKGGSISAMPMAGIPFQVQEGGQTSGVISFQNLGAVIDFRIYSEAHAGEQVRSITLTVTDGSNPVSGQGTLDLTRVNPAVEASMAVTWGDSSPSSVTLEQIGTATLSKDISMALGNLYMVVAPGTYSGTITVTTNAATYTFPFTGKTFNRNTLKRFNMNLDGPNATREAYYTRVQSASEMVDGDKYLIAYININNSTDAKLFHPVWGGNNYSGKAESVYVMNNTIPSTPVTDACQFILEAVPGSATDYYLRIPDGHYLTFSNGSIGSGKTASTISFNSNGVTIQQKVASWWQSQTYYLRYNNPSFTGSSSSSTLVLYKRDNGGSPVQELHFSERSFSYFPNGEAFPVSDITGIPVLSGAVTPVTYTTGDPSVATVDPITGAITIQGEGQTWITATAEADESHTGGTASYLLEAGVFSLENDAMAEYFDYVDAHPYNPSDYSYSYVWQFSSPTSETNRLDLPRPVTVRWTNPLSSNVEKTVVIYNDADHTKQEMTVDVSATATSADIYSLIPGRQYWYVVNNGGSTLTDGSFSTTGHRRIMKVGENTPFGNTYANNCRDLGGLETTDGRTLKYGKIFRGTNMDGTNTGQKEYLLNYMNIGLDVDLRESTGKNPLGVTVSDQIYNSIDNLTDASRMSITIGDILDAVADGKGVYIHCKVGADRTAYVCMLLELMLGVRQELCDVDYELTSFCAAVDDVVRERGNKVKNYYYYPLGIEFLSGKTGATLQEKAFNYVKTELGISEERIAAFKEQMLEGTPKQ